LPHATRIRASRTWNQISQNAGKTDADMIWKA
jgi:hypothetical protein